MRAWTIVGALALVWATAGCSGGDSQGSGDDAAVSVASTAAESDGPSTTETSVAATVEVTAAETSVTTTAPPTTTPPITSPLAASGVGGIEIVSPTTGAGERPTFEWATVDGATEYSLVVSDAATGAPIWAWRGPSTSVPLGAGLIDGQEGPRLTGPATLDVFALAATGGVLAASGPVLLAP